MSPVRIAPYREFQPLELSPSSRVFVLTGAGVSAESGFSTFRDSGGLWEKHRVEDVATPEGWVRDRSLVWQFYAGLRAQAGLAKPNSAHIALAALERAIGDRMFLCTQNVDDLHEKAGSRRVVHMHGELMKSRCERWPVCDRGPFEDACPSPSLPTCACGAHVRPHIVWFGEVPLELDRIGDELDTCHVFVTIGSSGSVYPAAGFVSAVQARRRRGDRSPVAVYVGPEAPDNATRFDECRLGKACETLPTLF
ncbi:MAG: Sir2 family NAD-dependent protein deacetylase [Polyangiaceae bacterium]|jgi:NAD-dependent deacetylase